MATFKIITTQEFQVTYLVEAETPDEAWNVLMDGEGECLDQIPGDIIGTQEESEIGIDS